MKALFLRNEQQFTELIIRSNMYFDILPCDCSCLMSYFLSATHPQINAFGKIIMVWTQTTFESIGIDKWFGWKYLCLELNFMKSDMFTGLQFFRHMNIWCKLFCDPIHFRFMYQWSGVNQIWLTSNQLIHIHIALKRLNEMRCNKINWCDWRKRGRKYCSLAHFN